MHETNLDSFDLIDKAITLVAQRNSGKTHLLSYMIINTIKKQYDNVDVINIIIFCQSLINSNTYFQLWIHINLDKLLFEPNQDGYDLIGQFKLKDHIDKSCIMSLVKHESDYTIKTILNHFIQYLINKKMVNKINNKKYINTEFIFNGSINKDILQKINNSEIKSSKNRKFIIIIDDVRSSSYKAIKDDVIFIYEQGRHHDVSIIVIDQYIRSKKVPPEIRIISSHIIFRGFDETIKEEIANICSINKKKIDSEAINELINNYYAIIIDFNDKTKLMYSRAPPNIFTN